MSGLWSSKADFSSVGVAGGCRGGLAIVVKRQWPPNEQFDVGDSGHSASLIVLPGPGPRALQLQPA